MQTDSGRQTGNVIAFIIVGIALAGLLAGGIYISKQQGRVASRTDTVSVDTSGESSKTGEEKTQEGATPPAQQPAQTPQQPAQTTPQPQSAPPVATTGPSGDASSTPQPQVPHTGPSSIASTGPADGVLPAITFGLLTIGLLSYLRSSRTYRSTALK